MTIITFYHKNGNIQGFNCNGHSGYAKAGEDIVCAAISSQVTACINSLINIAGIDPILRIDEGKALIHLILPDDLTNDVFHDCQVILKVLKQGMEDLESEYPRYIKIGGKLC